MTDGWTILIFGAVGFWGVLGFLKLVSCELERAAQQFKQAELIARRALARQRELESTEAVETVEAQAA